MTATIFVCVSCRRDGSGEDGAADRPGHALVQAIEARLSNRDRSELRVRQVDCLAVCKRPCTVALSASDKWSYLIGDIDPGSHANELIRAARSFAASETGIVPWRERPVSFRKGVIARVPPLALGAAGDGLS